MNSCPPPDAPIGATGRPRAGGRLVTRRRILGLGAAAVGVAAAGVVSGTVPLPHRLRRIFLDQGPAGTIPNAPKGDVRLEYLESEARGRTVGFFTAVPDGHGDGQGLPVCLVLHGASATTADFEDFGLPQFLTAAVQAGVPPFVLAGADGGVSRWAGDGGLDDPQTMLRYELPDWCSARGFDTSRIAAHGWSMGGYGSLLLAIRNPDWLRGVAVLSPAVGGGEVDDRADQLDGSRIAIWCGTADSLKPAIEALSAEIPGGPSIERYAPGAHTRAYWNRVTPEAMDFIGHSLTPP